MSEGLPSRSIESKDGVLPNHDDLEWTAGHEGPLEDHAAKRKRETGCDPAATQPPTPESPEEARGRHEHISGSGQWRAEAHERQDMKRSVAGRLPKSHKRRRVNHILGSPSATAASTTASTTPTMPACAQEIDPGYESSPSDYSEIWNDYHPSSSDELHAASQEMNDECKGAYSRLYADPPRPSFFQTGRQPVQRALFLERTCGQRASRRG